MDRVITLIDGKVYEVTGETPGGTRRRRPWQGPGRGLSGRAGRLSPRGTDPERIINFPYAV